MNSNQKLPSQLKDYFGNESTQVKNYEAYRPKYPEEIIKLMREIISKGEKKSYLDVACGTGQLLFQLQDLSDISIGTDISEKQLSVVQEKIKEKNLQESVHQIKADCHQLPQTLKQNNLPHKFDCITIGQALHWFDVHPFLKMVGTDLLKPEGNLMVVSYAFKGFEYSFDDEEYSKKAKEHNDIFNAQKTVPLYKFDYQEVYNGYPNYKFNEIYRDVQKIDQVTNTPATVDQLINFVKTFSAYNTYVELNNSKEGYIDPAEELKASIENDIKEYYQKNSHLKMPEYPIKITNYFFLIINKHLI